MVVNETIAFVQNQINESIRLKLMVMDDKDFLQKIAELADICANTLINGNKIIFAGNGGSFADAQHLAGEFISKLKRDRSPLPAITLGTNNSAFSAIGNDYGFENVFARELDTLSKTGDLFIPISTSGNSPNILKAIRIASDKKITTIGLTGSGGGSMAKLVSTICIPSNDVARIQECHIMLGHIICDLAERSFIE